MSAIEPSTNNRLLAVLESDDLQSVTPHLRPVTLNLSQVLYRPGEKLRSVYFPTSSIISLLTDLADGSGLEVGLVGKEGMVGLSAMLGGTETQVATVQASGGALEMPAEKMRDEFARAGAFQRGLLRYTHALMTQISQSVVCNLRHPIESRLARWLLMYHDRLGRDEFELTQEFIARMLGVRRSGISEVAANLQGRGLISYSRGKIRILDRKGLEEFTCECYQINKELYETYDSTSGHVD